MARFCGVKESESILEAAQHWKQHALLSDSSIFSSENIWNSGNLDVLNRDFINQLDMGEGDFFQKLQQQLSNSGPSANKLASEMLWLMLLCPSNITAGKKKEIVQRVWNWSGDSFPEETYYLDEAYLGGIGSAGTSFNTNRWRELVYFIHLMRAFKRLSQVEQAHLAGDAESFALWLEQIPENNTRQLRHMLLFLLFPDQFERIFGGIDRRTIVRTISGKARKEIRAMTAYQLDQELAAIRTEQEKQYPGEALDFYLKPLRDKWKVDVNKISEELTLEDVLAALNDIDIQGVDAHAQSTFYDLIHDGKRYPPKLVYSMAVKHASGEEFDRMAFKGGEGTECFNTLRKLGFIIKKRSRAVSEQDIADYESTRYWIVAPGEGAGKWDEFYSEGIIGLGWDEIGDISQYSNREGIREVLLSTYPEGSKSRTNDSLALWQFYREMKQGDILITKRGTTEYLGYGVVTSDYYFDETRDLFKNVRKVDWKANGVWHEEQNPIVLKTLTDITKYPDYVARLKSKLGILLENAAAGAPSYWWLNANPKHWKIDDYEVGQEQSYTTRNEKGNKRQKYDYFTKVKPGDLVIGYESTPVKKVTAIFEISRGIHIDDEDGEEKISFVIKQFFPPGERLTWEQIRHMPELGNCEVLKNNQGSLFKLEQGEFEALVNESTPQVYETYGIDDALSEVFISEDKLRNILYSLRNKKNIILQGPPGTGKTYIAKRLAYLLFGVKDSSKIEMVQFHQSYSYEDFIQGYRPGGTGFKLKNGVFYNFCKIARNDPNNNYVFIIDEINRGNLSKIFGELMMLIEADKRGPEWSMPLTYGDSQTEKFYVPENLYILGLMNTADRSLAMVDYALRRRFAFVDLEPGFSTGAFRQHLLDHGASSELIDKIITKMNTVNARISKDAANLGRGYCIGHSFFCATPNQGSADESWYQHVVETEIAPLLREYWFDDPGQADSIIQDILLSD